MKDLIRTPKEITLKSIRNAYDFFMTRRTRLRELEKAYETGQVPPEDHPYVVNNCRIIADTKSSYIAGIPPTYSAPDDDEKGQAIIDLYKKQVKQQLDQELTNLCSRYGVAFEVAYLEQTYQEDGTMTVVPKSVALSPIEGFVAYDETLDPDSVFGAIHYVEVDEDRIEHHYLDLYDAHDKVRYQMTDENGGSCYEIPGTRQPHGFDRVPITEYRNNPDMIGDFEGVIPLQRALNEVLSDRVKDKNTFANAYLVTQGFNFGETQDEVEEVMGKVNDMKYIAAPRDATLQFLTKTFDESSVQILVDYIDGQMHKVSGIPNMTDESFASNASGVAIKYKLMGLENLAQSFISQFNRGFLRRCKLYSYALYGPDGARVDEMRVTFKFNLPADSSYDAQTMQIYVNAGTMSRRTMMEQCPYVADIDEEQRRLDAEAGMRDEMERVRIEDQLQSQFPSEDELDRRMTAEEESAEADDEVE